ncbi:MAG: D-cysteine desulfhydrase family protein [Desulfurococcales archaeon]|nr:D-cysteine desulfhydrase family protein [Desulfurococcales archaeon]
MIWRAFNFPRYRLVSLPTPLEKALNISRDLGVRLYIKRDDVMELALGGNKVRKLEFILGNALAKGCDTLITRGAFHSNHARLTAAAARKAGLDVYLVLTPPGSPDLQGNVLLDKLLGAKMVYAKDYREADKVMQELADKLRAEGRKPYIILGGGASPYGVLGYIHASLELMQQLYTIEEKPRYIVLATGTGTTQAGLLLGLKLLGVNDVKVIGISISRNSDEARNRVYNLINDTINLLNIDMKVDYSDIIVYDDYVFGGYSEVTREVVDTMKYTALKEGLILDPVYTAKAMYGLIDLIRRGCIEKDSTVVFIHTGGTPIPFQLNKVIEKYL